MKLIIWVGLLRENVIIHFRERKYEYENSMNLLFASFYAEAWREYWRF